MTSGNPPVRLVIYCHSGGGIVTDKSSEAENVDFAQYLVSKGYAVLDMGGMPITYAHRLKIDPGRTVGSHISLRSMIKGYQYVIDNFDIAKDGCFLFGSSNGGLLASNIINLTKIPVLAQSGVAPLLSIENNAWNIASGPVFVSDFTSYQNRANIIRIYGMRDVRDQTELLAAKYEKEKVGIYDPFDYCINQSTGRYRTPYLIFTFKEDASVFYYIARQFSDEMKKRGSNIVISDIEEYGGHNVPANPIIVGDYNYMGEKKPLKLTVKTVGDFFDSYNPDISPHK